MFPRKKNWCLNSTILQLALQFCNLTRQDVATASRFYLLISTDLMTHLSTRWSRCTRTMHPFRCIYIEIFQCIPSTIPQLGLGDGFTGHSTIQSAGCIHRWTRWEEIRPSSFRRRSSESVPATWKCHTMIVTNQMDLEKTIQMDVSYVYLDLSWATFAWVIMQ